MSINDETARACRVSVTGCCFSRKHQLKPKKDRRIGGRALNCPVTRIHKDKDASFGFFNRDSCACPGGALVTAFTDAVHKGRTLYAPSPATAAALLSSMVSFHV
jgi:hypothetical protein